MMTRRQKETYVIICEQKEYSAKGNYIATCKILMQLGLIKPKPDAKELNVYVLNGKPLKISVVEKLPLLKEISINPVAKAIVWPSPTKPTTVYSNVSREQHVERWIGKEMPKDVVLPIKSLNKVQMAYIADNYEKKEAQEMADHLSVDVLYVRMFCQLNGYQIYKKRKKQDNYHQIPIERKQRMARIGYNGPQNKTA